MFTRRLQFCVVVIISGIIYYLTICPTVEFIDSGELALACKYLGIAHPTGYPLYTLLGFLFAKIPFGSLIDRVNFLSLLLTALATGFLFMFLNRITAMNGQARRINLMAISIALFVSFSPVWWSQGTSNEVYPLNLLLMIVSIWALFEFSSGNDKRVRWLFLSAYALGLCFANHLSAVYLIPGFVYILVAETRRTKDGKLTTPASILFVAFPLTLYLFLPLRAQHEPFLNWGNVSDPFFLYKHITGWQYRVWMFTNPLGIFKDFNSRIIPAASLIYDQFKWYGLILMAVGLIVSIRRNKRLLVFAALIWFANLIYVLNYEIGDIESYYLPMIFVSSAFMAIALAEATRWIDRRRTPVGRPILITILILFPLANLIFNYVKADRSRKVFARQGVYDIAKSVGQNGVGIIENWDFYSPWLYFRFEENLRPDLVMLDKELMRRSWYIDFIRRYHPDIYRRSQSQFEEFLHQVKPFERGKSFDADVIDRAYYGMLDAVIDNESSMGPVYTNVVSDPKFAAGRPRIPDGIMFKFDSPAIFAIRPRFQFADSIWENPAVYKDRRVGYLLTYYARAFESRQKYCAYFKRIDEAKYYEGLYMRVRRIISEIE
jgi:hypothetical protein